MPTPKKQSLEQQAIMDQMAAQAAPIMPPPPTPNPMSQLPVPPERISNAENSLLRSKLKEQSLSRESEMEKIKLFMQQYSQLNQGTDYRPIAALISGLTGNQQLMQAAEAIAPESKAKVAQNLIGYQAKLAQLMGDQRQSEALLKNQTEMARLNLAASKNSRGDLEQEYRKERNLENNVQKLEKRIGDITPGIYTKLQNLEKALPGGIEGGEEVDADIPGVGVGQFMVPDFMMGDEASNIQQNARGLAADLIKLQSGTAASDKEVDRKMKELGMSPGSKASSFRNGLIRLKDQVAVELRNKQAGYDADVNYTYKDRGGITSDDISAIGKRVPSAPDIKEWDGKKFQLKGDKWVEVK